MRFLNSIFKRIRLWIKSRRLSRFRRTPKVFIPILKPWQIVIPFRAISSTLLVFLIIACGYLFLRSDIFLIKQLIITKDSGWQGKEFVLESEVRESLNSFLARSLLTISQNEVQNKLTTDFLTIKEVKVKKELPDRLLVFYQERIPVAVIKTLYVYEEEVIEKNEVGEEIKKPKKTEQAGSFFVDEEGLIFVKKEGKFGLPEFILINHQNLQVGDSISGQQVSSVLKIITNLKESSDLKIVKISFQESGLIEVIFSEGLEVLFGGVGKNIDSQISTLQTLHRRSKIDGKKISRIDLRFQNPVIK